MTQSSWHGSSQRLSILAKKKGRALVGPSLPLERILFSFSALEFELHAQPGIERTQIPGVGVAVHGGGSVTRWLQEVSVRNSDGALRKLIEAQLGLVVGDVEQVSTNAQTRSFGNPDRIVHVVVDTAEVRRTAQRTARRGAINRVVRAERNFACVGVDRVRVQVVDRDARLEVHRAPHRQPLGMVAAEGVADESVR